MAATERRAPAGGAVLPSLTGMRMLAAGGVFLTHIKAIVPDVTFGEVRGHVMTLTGLLGTGGLGVNFFFILSGFVLAWSWKPGTSASSFYLRRVARIWPSHAVMWAIVLLVSIAVVGLRTGLWSTLLNLVLLHGWSTSTHFGVNQVAWTLSCEAFFYAAFPAFWAWARTLGATALAAVGVGATLVPFVIAAATEDGFVILGFPPSRIWEFFLGVVLARGVQQGWLRWAPPIWIGLGLFGAVVLASSVAPLGFMAVAAPTIPLAAIITRGALNDLAGTPTVLASPAAQLGGRWSFAFYLVHFTIAVVAIDTFDLDHESWGVGLAWVALVFVLAVGAAGALHQFVEKPAERAIRHRLITP